MLVLSLTINCCGQINKENEVQGLLINPNIKSETEKNINDINGFEKNKNGIQIFESIVGVESFVNDKLVFASSDRQAKQLFKSFYLWKDDTLSIDGVIGLFGGAGFTIKIHKNKATVYHLVSSDESPNYAYHEKGSMTNRLEVPCRDVKLILSEIPDSTKLQAIYGYVEFKSEIYYSGNANVNGHRMKHRANMKMYFRSGILDIKE